MVTVMAARHPRPLRRSTAPTHTGLRQVSIVALPGAGGPALAAELRTLRRGTATPHVRLVVPAGDPETTPMLIGDPLTGVFWPFAYPTRDAGSSRIAARRRANRLWWFLWEHDVEAECVIREGSAMAVALAEREEHQVDVVLVASGPDRRTRRSARDVQRRGRRAGLDVQLVVDGLPVSRDRGRRRH